MVFDPDVPSIHRPNKLYNPITDSKIIIHEPKQEEVTQSEYISEYDKSMMRRTAVSKYLARNKVAKKDFASDTETSPDADIESLSDHKILELYQRDDVRRRFIFLTWPRNPKGQILPKVVGKYATEERYSWGSSVLHFFVVTPYPTVPQVLGFMSSSQLLKALASIDELDFQKDLVDFAKAEGDPRPLPPYDIAKLILEDEQCIRNLEKGKTLAKESPWWTDEDSPVFAHSGSPLPWPMEPFSYSPAKLEKRIPFGLLPEILYVHASPQLLSASRKIDIEKEPLVFKYRIKLTTESLKRSEAHTSEELAHHEYLPKNSCPGPIPAIRAVLPLRPHITRPKEAHLYLSPNSRAGVGHHSYVYHADLDLPRDFLVPDILCQQCIDESVQQEVVKEDGKDKCSDFVTASKCLPKETHVHLGLTDKGVDLVDPLHDHADNIHSGYENQGEYRLVKSNVEYQNLARKPYCSHIQNLGYATHPLTARVRVAAKLSVRGDEHLERETKNYQQFPDFFFENYSGYHFVKPVRQILPITAIVPQFYGYYVPDASSKRTPGQYLSPILLMEDCGGQIGDIKLSVDDEEECSGLGHRFKFSGWNHHSMYHRNVLHQPGPLWKHPKERGIPLGESGYDSAHSFRLIDFGRSKKGDSEDYDDESYHQDMKDMQGLFRFHPFPL